MNIEEAIKRIVILQNEKSFEAENYEPYFVFNEKDKEAFKTLLTAYEQKCNYIKENEIYKKNLFNNYEEKCKELEKEKEKNKKLTQCHFQYEEMTGIDLLLPSKEE